MHNKLCALLKNCIDLALCLQIYPNLLMSNAALLASSAAQEMCVYTCVACMMCCAGDVRLFLCCLHDVLRRRCAFIPVLLA